MIAMYDLEDNFITIFDSYSECAEYFQTTNVCIINYLAKVKMGIADKKKDKRENCWVRLFKIED